MTRSRWRRPKAPGTARRIPGSPRRSARTLSSTAKIRSVNYTIDTANGSVYLIGSARTQTELDRATGVARNVSGREAGRLLCRDPPGRAGRRRARRPAAAAGARPAPRCARRRASHRGRGAEAVIYWSHERAAGRLRPGGMRPLSARARRIRAADPADRRGGAGARLVRAAARRARPLSPASAATRPRCRAACRRRRRSRRARPRAQRDHPAEARLCRRRADLRRFAERQSDAGRRSPQRPAGGARHPLYACGARAGLGQRRASPFPDIF